MNTAKYTELLNTSWAVRVWSELEHNDFIVGDSETVPQVNPAILNITDKGELKYWLSKFVVEV